MPSGNEHARIWLTVALAAFLVLCWGLLRGVSAPWTEEDNYYGALYSQAAHNHLRAGLGATHGVPAPLYFGPLPLPPGAYYAHHPLLMPLLVTISIGSLGESEAAARLVPICSSLLAAIFLWLLVRETAGVRAATFCLIWFVIQPIMLHYGDMVDYEPCLMCWVLAALFSLRRWDTTHRNGWAVAFTGACLAAQWIDWPGIVFSIVVSVILLFRRNGGDRPLALLILGLTVLSLLVFIALVSSVYPDAVSDLVTAVAVRRGSGITSGSGGDNLSAQHHFTLLQWLGRIVSGFAADYLTWTWLFAFAGVVKFWLSRRDRSLRGLGNATLLVAVAGFGYMAVMPNWSFIHDWSSLLIAPAIAIAAGIGTEFIALRADSLKRVYRITVACAGALVALVSVAQGMRQADEQRSQLLMLDGVTAEPPTLIPDVGRYIRNRFPPDAMVLINFDPNYTTLAYYAQRTIWNNVQSPEQWSAPTSETVGGLIWLNSPSVTAILSQVPATEIERIEIDRIPFAVWLPRGCRRERNEGQR